MNHITVIPEQRNTFNSGSEIKLQINGNLGPSVAFDISDYARVRGNFDKNAGEFAYFTSVIYGCDRAIKRETKDGDRWTREFSVEIPIGDPVKWNNLVDSIKTMLEFLTGDIWHINFIPSSIPLFGREFRKIRSNFRNRRRINSTAVSLFSGGLDSLIGVIDWLEKNPHSNLLLAGTYDADAESAKSDQKRLNLHLANEYENRVQHFVARTGLCADGKDTNFRSRSLAFIGNAVLAASFIMGDTTILIPENGPIALNFPLTPSRRGSLSTRTVHPRFIKMLNNLLNELQFRITLTNPYQFKTKGEMMLECENSDLLKSTYSDSASCGKRGRKVYWENKYVRQCGACIPCIYRRSAIRMANYSEDTYGYALKSGEALTRLLVKANNDLPSVLDFINREDSDDYIWNTLRVNGGLEHSFKSEYVSLIKRLHEEVKAWAHSCNLI